MVEDSFLYLLTIPQRLFVIRTGFLKTGAKGSAQGNFGLMDLVAGLHWLRENLPAFNGDPSKVVYVFKTHPFCPPSI